MNVNVKLSLTDEQRNVMFRRLTGKNGMGKATRADVNQWVQDALHTFLTHGSPSTEQVEEPDPEKITLTNEQYDDIDPQEIEYIINQNRLLQSRVNRLQHLIDTRGLK